MNETQQQRLSANIHLLGNVLGETIIEQEGHAIFELEEQIRALSKRWRTGDPEAVSYTHLDVYKRQVT